MNKNINNKNVNRKKKKKQMFPPELLKIENFLELSVKRIFKINDKDQRDSALRALKKSIDVDLENSPNNPSSIELFEVYNIHPADQLTYLISLGKKEAFIFLKTIGRNFSYSTIKKSFNEKKYRRIFGKKKLAKHGKKIIYTYAEILTMSERTTVLNFPDDLVKILSNS